MNSESFRRRPKAFLFDIGGVCVASPFQAILDYERANGIPEGWINFSISRSAPNGAWQRLERGEIKLDPVFFAEFKSDLQNSGFWKEFLQKKLSKRGFENPANTEPQISIQQPPSIDAEWLFWEMMRISRNADPHMFIALQKLKASGLFLLAALSNTVVFPEEHPYNKPFESDIRSYFDVFVSSAHVGLRKPDPAIYELALNEMRRSWLERNKGSLCAEDVVFLDDIGENLKAAKAAGMRTIRVQLGRTEEAIAELEDLAGISLQKPQDTRPFTKLVKNSAYYSRYQVKYKRRRAGKTDYYARKRLITQAKNKYNAPKYRLVVRFTNRDIVLQIVTSEIGGDKVFVSAYAHELKRYGINHGLTNWSAAYATGLLIARRALKKLGLDEQFPGVEEPTGEYSLTEAAEGEDGEERRPFKCFLDVGLVRTSTGARVFGAMKGASDGGLYIPHSESRFPGYDIEGKELDADVLRNYIFGGHVAEYMETLADDDEERFKSQFQGYVDDDIEADGLEELYTEAHNAIREDPFKKDEEAGPKKSKDEWKQESLKHRQSKLSKEEKTARVQAKIAELKQ
ncbi:60S ribosomal protein L5 [Xylona heveae TC161]|uniref:60S ribosomal protein L5 n=1 Tax=Xylona heveae (strain CBS 132557 / TC161) TaxID=1328760 RepID=A0A164ZXL4_XYLHT|nr:60S ribosomal protein L5 [Xylona heveae TC161]KZF19663.1 60S ribosomal protein L5 [Xylona heveae TC161]